LRIQQHVAARPLCDSRLEAALRRAPEETQLSATELVAGRRNGFGGDGMVRAFLQDRALWAPIKHAPDSRPLALLLLDILVKWP